MTVISSPSARWCWTQILVQRSRAMMMAEMAKSRLRRSFKCVPLIHDAILRSVATKDLLFTLGASQILEEADPSLCSGGQRIANVSVRSPSAPERQHSVRRLWAMDRRAGHDPDHRQHSNSSSVRILCRLRGERSPEWFRSKNSLS